MTPADDDRSLFTELQSKIPSASRKSNSQVERAEWHSRLCNLKGVYCVLGSKQQLLSAVGSPNSGAPPAISTSSMSSPLRICCYSIRCTSRLGAEKTSRPLCPISARHSRISTSGALPISSQKATTSFGRWEGGGTHTGPAFSDFLVGSLPAATGRKMRFTGTTVLRIQGWEDR
jgi:hypothetical protein